MAVARKLGAFDYILKAERDLPKDQQTIWHCRALTWGEKRDVEATPWRINNGETFIIDRKGVQEKSLGIGLTGWTNWKDESGEEVAYQSSGTGLSKRLSPEILDLIEPHATELSNAIDNGAAVTEEEARNFTSP